MLATEIGDENLSRILGRSHLKTVEQVVIGSKSARAIALTLAGTFVMAFTGCAEVNPALVAEQGVTLDKTYWRLVAVDGAPVPPGTGRREPNIHFDSEKKRVTGYSGVNSFFGGYDTTSGGLRFSHMASTRMAGPPELMKLEDAFLKALAATTSYRITADELELLDSSGRALARFQGQVKP